MAIKLDVRYPGRASPADSNYPQGSFKNRTAPGVLDGSYLEKDWANDIFAYLQATLLRAGITPNDVVDTATASQYYDAFKSLTTIPIWNNLIDYVVPFMVFGSDGKLYVALLASGPSTTARDPVSQPTYWQTLSSFLGVGQASETVAGIAEIATQAETNTGTDDVRFVTPLKLKNSTPRGVGYGQAWQNVTGSRALTTSYTNSTGKPIQVLITCNSFATGTSTLTVDGVTVGRILNSDTAYGAYGQISAIIPAGSVYSLSAGTTIIIWAELR